MDVSAKNARIWRKDIEGRDGTFYRYSVSISSKREDGSWASAYMPIRFAKKANMPEKISNGAKCDFSGFLSVYEYRDEDGNTRKSFQIIAMRATLVDGGNPTEDVDSFEQLSEDLPF